MHSSIRQRFPLSDARWAHYSSCFTRMEAPARTMLLREGEVSRKRYFVEQGCLRAWFNHEGRDVTFQFFIEGSTVSSMESFRKKIPSPVSIETIEPSVLWWVHKKDMDNIVEEICGDPALRDRFIDTIYERTYDYMKHFVSFIRDTPEQRYLDLLRDRPRIVQRIPQHYIASWLGITSVHLSRIKSKLAKTKRLPRI
ncbi:MAG: Crp/Fnr family transcriptional regulator [Bacteroidetes bacterium]|nr:Crp/Fnr family transcriptional regulator [Bacteroidota bacterium]